MRSTNVGTQLLPIDLGYQLRAKDHLELFVDNTNHWNGNFSHSSFSRILAGVLGRDHACDMIVAAFAGYEAELLFAGHALHPQSDVDLLHYLVGLYDLFPGDQWYGLLRLRWEAREILQRRWDDVMLLAEELVEQEFLSGTEIMEMVGD